MRPSQKPYQELLALPCYLFQHWRMHVLHVAHQAHGLSSAQQIQKEMG